MTTPENTPVQIEKVEEPLVSEEASPAHILPNEASNELITPVSIEESQKDTTHEEPIPDWLKMPEMPSDAIVEEPKKEENKSILFGNDEPPTFTPSEDLPDWLKNSIEDANTSSEMTEDTKEKAEGEGKKIKSPKTKAPAKSVKKEKTEIKIPKKDTGTSTASSSDIPDWLK